MKGICHTWSRGRFISPSLPVGDDWYLNLNSQKRSPGRNLGQHRWVRRSGTASRGTVVLVFCLRMRSFPRAEVLTISLEKKCPHRTRDESQSQERLLVLPFPTLPLRSRECVAKLLESVFLGKLGKLASLGPGDRDNRVANIKCMIRGRHKLLLNNVHTVFHS